MDCESSPHIGSAELGFREKAVAGKRCRLGIRQRQNRPQNPEEDALLGKLPDAELARKLGRSESAVSQRRQLLGIPVKRE